MKNWKVWENHGALSQAWIVLEQWHLWQSFGKSGNFIIMVNRSEGEFGEGMGGKKEGGGGGGGKDWMGKEK